MPEPREWTAEEVRAQFLKHAWELIEYWHEQTDIGEVQKMSGVVFSLLAVIDGCDAGMPAFGLIPSPHEEDKEYCKGEGENWYPEDTVDIGGSLHELFHKYEPKGLSDAPTITH